MQSDVELLEEKYAKYKDKNGKKARSLKMRIESFKAFEKLQMEVVSKEKLKKE